MQEILKEIQKLSTVNKKSLEQIGLKIAEETGECVQALLSYVNANGSEYKDLGIEDVKEECVDIILVTLSLFFKLNGSNEELFETLVSKSDKWKDKAGIS